MNPVPRDALQLVQEQQRLKVLEIFERSGFIGSINELFAEWPGSYCCLKDWPSPSGKKEKAESNP